MEGQPKVKEVVGRIISYVVHYNDVNPPRVIYSGSMSLTSERPIGEQTDPHSLFDYIRKTAINTAKDAQKMAYGDEPDEVFSVVITYHFYP